jgi:hypothetical protein
MLRSRHRDGAAPGTGQRAQAAKQPVGRGALHVDDVDPAAAAVGVSMVREPGRPKQRAVALRLEEGDQCRLCSGVGDDVEVQSQTGMSVRGEGDASGDGEAMLLPGEEGRDLIECTDEVHGVIVA